MGGGWGSAQPAPGWERLGAPLGRGSPYAGEDFCAGVARGLVFSVISAGLLWVGGGCVCVNQNSAEEQRILPDTHQALCLTSNIFPFLSSQLLIFHEKASQDIFFFFWPTFLAFNIFSVTPYFL